MSDRRPIPEADLVRLRKGLTQARRAAIEEQRELEPSYGSSLRPAWWTVKA